MACDVTLDLFRACDLLPETKLVKPESFTLGDAMSAVNISDAKMDVGTLNPLRNLTNLNQAVVTGQVKLRNFSQVDLIKIMDRSIAMLVLWLRGEPPQLTILSNVYLQDIDRIEDRILSGFLLLYVNVAHACRRVLLAANAFDHEDFQPHVLNAGNKPQNFFINMNKRIRSFWDSTVNEFDCDPLDATSQIRSTDSVINFALEAAFTNLRNVDKKNYKRTESYINTSHQSQILSSDEEYTLANSIISRLRVLEYWHQTMLLKHLTGDPGFDVSSPLDYLRLYESLICSLEVIAESITIVNRLDESSQPKQFADLRSESSKENFKLAAEEDEKKLLRCLRHGQSVMGFDYLLNLECMDYPRLTFPDLSAHAAYRHIEQTFLHLYYCTRQLVIPSLRESSQFSVDVMLETLQRLTTDGSTQLIDPYAALDSVRIHNGRSHTAMHGKELSTATAEARDRNESVDAGGDANTSSFPGSSDDDDEDEPKPSWRGVGDTVFGAFTAYSEQPAWEDESIDDAAAAISVRPGYHDKLNVTEMRPNILVRSVLVLETVSIATRFSSTPDQPASWYKCSRDTILCFCMPPALTERDPFVCNEWSITPFPRGPKMSIWKFLNIYFDSSDGLDFPPPNVSTIREEYEEQLQPLIEDASNIIKERIRICGMNKAVQREACLRLVNEIAVYEERARIVDGRFVELFERNADMLHGRLVARPIIPSPAANPSAGGGGGKRSKQHQKAAMLQHTSPSANRPSQEQIYTLRRTFDYFQKNLLSSWFAFHLSDVLAQTFTLSLELGMYSSGNGVTDTRVQELEYIYWYQAQHVFRSQLDALLHARTALHHNQQMYRLNVQEFINRQVSSNFAKIAATLPPPPTPLLSTQATNSSQQQDYAQQQVNKSKNAGGKKAVPVKPGTAQNDAVALKAAAELAVRNEHRVLSTFAQRKLIESERCASIGRNFLDRQIGQASLIAQVCAAFTFTIRLLRLMNMLDADSFEMNPAGKNEANNDAASNNSDKLIRLDIEELSYYHRLFPYSLAQEVRELFFCSYDDYKNETIKVPPLLLNFASADGHNLEKETGTETSASAKFVQENDSDSFPLYSEENRQQINFLLAALPKMFDRIEAKLGEYASASSKDRLKPTANDLENGEVRSQTTNRDTDAAAAKNGVASTARDNIVLLYSDALRETLKKICRHNRKALLVLSSSESVHDYAQMCVKLDFTECSVFPVLRIT